MAAVVGNEDGAHHISAILFHGLNDVDFTLPAQAVACWNDEAMGKRATTRTPPKTPDRVASTTKALAANAFHLATLLQSEQCPPTP